MTRSVLIGYDLNSPGGDYESLIDTIKSLSTTWWHHLDSTWVIRTELTAEGVHDMLVPHLDVNDELLVIDVTVGSAAWTGFNTRGSNWLSKHL